MSSTINKSWRLGPRMRLVPKKFCWRELPSKNSERLIIQCLSTSMPNISRKFQDLEVDRQTKKLLREESERRERKEKLASEETARKQRSKVDFVLIFYIS